MHHQQSRDCNAGMKLVGVRGRGVSQDLECGATLPTCLGEFCWLSLCSWDSTSDTSAIYRRVDPRSSNVITGIFNRIRRAQAKIDREEREAGIAF